MTNVVVSRANIARISKVTLAPKIIKKAEKTQRPTILIIIRRSISKRPDVNELGVRSLNRPLNITSTSKYKAYALNNANTLEMIAQSGVWA